MYSTEDKFFALTYHQKLNPLLDITLDKTRKMTKVVEQIKKLMGTPRNYGKNIIVKSS